MSHPWCLGGVSEFSRSTVEGSIAAFVGQPKNGKTWTLLDLAIAIAAGQVALKRFAVPNPGPVLLILEESGRAALHRRLDMLVRGRALEPGRLVELYYAANRRVRLAATQPGPVRPAGC
jgi:RecA-family ATPase